MRIFHNPLILALSGCALLGLSLNCQKTKPQKTFTTEPALIEDDSVAFDLTAAHEDGDWEAWIGVYNRAGRVAKFRIELSRIHRSAAEEKQQFSFKSGSGRFLPEKESDGDLFLLDLAKALHAKTPPKASVAQQKVEFEFVNLGDEQSRASGGGFSRQPAGNWTTMKIFFGNEVDESEVFFNINRKAGKAEFSMKDPDYGDAVLAELAKVL